MNGITKFTCHSYAIGGLAGGEDKDSFWRVVAQCTAALPEDKPRYVMVHIAFIKNLVWQFYIFIYLFFIILFLMYFLIPWFVYGPGCWIPSRYCGLQCFGCWHVWLCLSYSHRSLWHSSGAWGDNLICDMAIIHNQFSWVMPSITSLILAEMQGVLKLKHQAMANDIRPIDPTCDCMVCSFTVFIASFWLQIALF